MKEPIDDLPKLVMFNAFLKVFARWVEVLRNDDFTCAYGDCLANGRIAGAAIFRVTPPGAPFAGVCSAHPQ